MQLVSPIAQRMLPLSCNQQKPMLCGPNTACLFQLLLAAAQVFKAAFHRKVGKFPGNDSGIVYQRPGVEKAQTGIALPCLLHRKARRAQELQIVLQGMLRIGGDKIPNQFSGEIVVVFTAHLLGDEISAAFEYPIHLSRVKRPMTA